MFLLLHQVRAAYRKGSGDFGVNKGISPYLVFLCLLVLRLSASSRAALSETLLLHLLSEKKTEKRFPCVLSSYFVLRLIIYHLKHLNSLCAYTNKRGKISLLSVTL